MRIRKHRAFLSLPAVFIMLPLFFGCAKAKTSESAGSRLTVVATVFPLYDWAKNAAGISENIQTELLIKNGVDLHSFQPSTADIVKILSADVLLYVGGESDFWIEDALKNSLNKKMTCLNLMELLGDSVKEEEEIEGMTEESGEKHFSLSFNAHSHDETEYDEHIWLSVENAKKAVNIIASVLAEKDSAEKDVILSGTESYLKQLDELALFRDGLPALPDTIIVCDRFPFRYMTDELNLKYFAAFAGCSAETEASFETIAFLSDKIKTLKTHRVFVTESSDKKIARTVIKNAGLKESECSITVLDSMQSVTLEESASGKSYIGILKDNYMKIAAQDSL